MMKIYCCDQLLNPLWKFISLMKINHVDRSFVVVINIYHKDVIYNLDDWLIYLSNEIYHFDYRWGFCNDENFSIQLNCIAVMQKKLWSKMNLSRWWKCITLMIMNFHLYGDLSLLWKCTVLMNLHHWEKILSLQWKFISLITIDNCF